MFQFPAILRSFFPGICWHFPRSEKILYLTFDDGPDPEVTPKVLELLKQYKAQATFFCIGKNVEVQPDIYQRILHEGHRVGNHTWSHLDAWKTNSAVFMSDVQRAADIIHSDLFRPPYGRITPPLLSKLKQHYRVVLWDVITYDWKPEYSAKKVQEIVKKHAKHGSVIVFHDSPKAASRMLPALEHLLCHYSDEGYRFGVID